MGPSEIKDLLVLRDCLGLALLFVPLCGNPPFQSELRMIDLNVAKDSNDL